MRRPSARKQAVSVSLFPFLAVLICTMGALIVLLVLVVKQAEVQASETQQQQTAQLVEAKQKLREKLDFHAWRRETLEQSRPEMSQQLATGRLELSHLEAHIRQLKEKASQLKQQLDDLEQVDAIKNSDSQAAAVELAELKRQIEVSQRELVEAQKQAADRPRSYSIVPYKGPNGTNRRPIYVECTGNAVIIQPEGVVLQARDFIEPLVPGNPLDAALLAVREFLAQSGAIAVGGEPYPLLIVRPDGATTYSKARSAMKSWDDEFGYELIDDKLNLKYPDAEPALEKAVREAVELARRRQEALIRSQPSRFPTGGGGGFGKDDRVVLRPKQGGGGFVREGGSNSESWPGFSNGESEASGGRNKSERTDQENNSPTSNNQSGTADGSANSGGQNIQPGQMTSRGKNWGVPDWSPGATAYTRPIRIVCLGDRLVLVPQQGSGLQPIVTQVSGPISGSIDEFVASVWKHMESWGIAGRNAYWKPVLNVEVAPSAEKRFTKFQVLLQNSGLEVRRKR